MGEPSSKPSLRVHPKAMKITTLFLVFCFTFTVHVQTRDILCDVSRARHIVKERKFNPRWRQNSTNSRETRMYPSGVRSSAAVHGIAHVFVFDLLSLRQSPPSLIPCCHHLATVSARYSCEFVKMSRKLTKLPTTTTCPQVPTTIKFLRSRCN